ncbi:MAG: DNA adenine methylase [Caulobacteraceae bacterium]
MTDVAPCPGPVVDVSRPAIRYLGGKFRLARRILPHFPPHRTYVEPFGGAGSVLAQKPRAYAEIYNDLDGELINLFRVLRDPVQSVELVRLVGLTPFARIEFEDAYVLSSDPVERARRLIVRASMGHGNIAARIDRTTGFRRDARRSSTIPAHDWMNLPPALAVFAERMRGVVIESRPASELIAHFDGPDTLIYADPPYVHSTRSEKRTRLAPSSGYVHEMSDEEHVALLEQLRDVQGGVVLSGYAHPIYDERLSDWKRVEIVTHADGARPRIEVLWINGVAARGVEHQGFEGLPIFQFTQPQGGEP